LAKQTITLKDVAKQAKVSLAAASMALAGDPKISEETRLRVERAKRRLDYRPLRRRPKQMAKTTPESDWLRCGLVIVRSGEQDKNTRSWTQFGLMSEIALSESIKLEMTVIDSQDPADQHRMLEAAATDVDCVLFYGHVNRKMLAHMESQDTPAILLGQVAGDPVAPVRFGHIVTSDHLAFGQYATRCLIEAGHKRIGFFISTIPGGLWYERCLAGYRQAMAEAEIPVEPGLIQLTGPGGLVGEKAANAYCKLKTLPTAYVSPDMDNAKQFLGCMADRGHKIAPDTIVIGTSQEHPLVDDFSEYPMVLEDLRLLVETTFKNLRTLATNRDAVASKLLIPFNTRNLPIVKKD